MKSSKRKSYANGSTRWLVNRAAELGWKPGMSVTALVRHKRRRWHKTGGQDECI